MQAFTFIIALMTFIMMVSSAPLVARSSYSGEATYYNVGLGSCGQTNSDSDMVAALSSNLMSSKGNCGKSITIKGPSSSVTVKVVDTCPGCSDGNVDLSPSAFQKLGSLDKGRIPISWSI